MTRRIRLAFGDRPCRNQLWEQVLVQALVTQATIEAFDEAVLLRLAGRDVVLLDFNVLALGKDCVTRAYGNSS